MVEALTQKIRSNAELQEILGAQQLISGREDSSKTDGNVVEDNMDTVSVRDDSSQKIV